MEVGEAESHGSCRSIPELHMTEALDQVADLLERYGGHAAAAGLTIANENIPEFKRRLTEYVEERLANEDLRPTVTIDAEIDIAEVDWALHEVLQALEPTGCANATPIFVSRGVEVVHSRVVGRDQSHLQIEFVVSETRTIQSIAFGYGSWGGRLPMFVDIAYTLSVNEWKGRKKLQLQIQDIQPS